MLSSDFQAPKLWAKKRWSHSLWALSQLLPQTSLLPWTDHLTARVLTRNGNSFSPRASEDLSKWSQASAPLYAQRTGWEGIRGAVCYGQSRVVQGSLGKAPCCQGWDKGSPRQGQQRRGAQATCFTLLHLSAELHLVLSTPEPCLLWLPILHPQT